MMRPRPCARMCGRTAFVIRTRPKTLMSKTRWSWATELSSAAPAAADAGIVDQDVDPPEPLDHLLDGPRCDRLVAGHVEVEERHAARDAVTRGVAARSDHVEPGLDERERGCLPDA